MSSDSIQSLSPHHYGRREWTECMDRVKQHDKAAYAIIFRFYAPKLKSFVFKFVHSEQVSAELVQDVMSVVWQKAMLFDGEKSALSTWIFTIARNLCFDVIRKQKGAEAYVYADDIWPNEYCPPDLIEYYAPEHERLKEQVLQKLALLPKPQQDIVRAVFIDEMPQQEVADLFNIPLGTVKSRLRLAVEKLRISIDVEHL
ncbi:sigma-70 family RNA polymerase sigma factor [Vibrio porteresiae]|uniref:sigma-70 family RNA polymerase sigma factor n=1 Tax=Vibrio porteresiae TaxID=435912 RepID=UPI003571188E